MSSSIVQLPQSRLNKAVIDKWVFIFNIPKAMRRLISDKTGKGNIDTGAVQFSLKAVNVPDVTVQAISQPYGSGNLYVSSHAKDPFELLNIKFDIDNEFKNWSTIYEWLNLLHDEKYAIPDAKNKIDRKFGVESYWTTLGLLGLDEYNVVKIKFEFTQAFPTKITGINFDYTQAEKLDATAVFAFSQLHVSYPNKEVITG